MWQKGKSSFSHTIQSVHDVCGSLVDPGEGSVKVVHLTLDFDPALCSITFPGCLPWYSQAPGL